MMAFSMTACGSGGENADNNKNTSDEGAATGDESNDSKADDGENKDEEAQMKAVKLLLHRI